MPSIALLTSFFEKVIFYLDYWDKRLFIEINIHYTNKFLNAVFPVFREATTWIPLYVFLIVLMLINFGYKSYTWILCLIVTIALSDQLSSSFLKNFIARPRPCQDIFVQLYGRLLLNRCPSSYSFTSSHATNHFAAAMFIYQTLKTYLGKWGKLFFVWAATISYGQVYVGVHYPIDIIAGCMLGCMLGYISANFYSKKIGLPQQLTYTI